MQGFELKANARKQMRENAPKLFFISIAIVVILTVMSELQFRLPGTAAAYSKALERLAAGETPSLSLFFINYRPVGVMLAGLLLLIRPVVEIGFMNYCLKTSRGGKGSFSDALDGFQFFVKAILIRIITTILVALWSLLFLFPGIVAFYRYRQAYYILLDTPGKSALDCIRESKKLMAGNKLNLFLIDVSFIGWYICDMLIVILLPVPFSLPIVSIWLMPYTGLTSAAFYDRLMTQMAV